MTEISAVPAYNPNMALAQLCLGDPKAAEATLVEAVELNPGFAAAVDLLAKVRQAQ